AVGPQRMRQQSQPATEVQQRRGRATQCVADAGVQRVAAELGAAVVVVPAVAQRMAGSERGGDRACRRGAHRSGGGRHGVASIARATGNACCAHNSYIAADGCRPSSTTIAASPPCARLLPVMSTKATPCSAHSAAAMAL